MKPTPLLKHLLLTEDMSPIPSSGEGWNSPLIRDGESDMRIQLYENRAVPPIGSKIPSFDMGRKWRTTKAHVTAAYANEFARILGYVSSIAGHIRIVVQHPPKLAMPHVSFISSPSKHLNGYLPRRTYRLCRLLAEAVRTSDKSPNSYGPRILNLNHWLTVVAEHFSPLLDARDETLGLMPQFIPVLEEWIRLTGLAAGERKRIMRAKLGISSDPAIIQHKLATLTQNVINTASLLANHSNQSGLAFYKLAARAVLDLQETHPASSDGLQLTVLFVEDSSSRRFVTPAVGLAIPPLLDGYPLVLEDGTTDRLPHPPWAIGYGVDSSSFGAQSEEGAK